MNIKTIILISILSLSALFVNAQTGGWANNSAKVIEQGAKEKGLFAPFKIGLKNNTELSTQPLLFFLIPNVAVKKQWKGESEDDIFIASKHKFTYPTLLLNTLATEGAGGILPNTSVIPQLFKFNNSVLASKNVANQLMTLELGVDVTFSFGDSDFPSIDYLVYHSTYSFNNGFTPYITYDVTGHIYGAFDYDINVGTYIFTGDDSGILANHKFRLIWNVSPKFAINGGALFQSGEFPYGHGTTLLPAFDLMLKF